MSVWSFVARGVVLHDTVGNHDLSAHARQFLRGVQLVSLDGIEERDPVPRSAASQPFAGLLGSNL